MAILKEQRIIVMGGSFNPPTMAHFHLMEAAIQAVGAEKGVYVPVGQAYLKRKMRKAGERICLGEAFRMELLRAMCGGREDMEVSDIEMRNPLLYTNDTMNVIQEMYPETKLYFLAGADKLPLIGRWAAKTDFLKRFGVVLFSREGVDPREIISQDEHMSAAADAFVHIKQPDDVGGISSTAVRRLIEGREADRAQPYLHPAVWQRIHLLRSENFPKEIERFEGQYEFLSNSYPSGLVYDGLSFSCVEAAFQAMRCAEPADRRRFLTCDGKRAKAIAARILPRANWENEREQIMEKLLAAKFEQHPALKQNLLDTGNDILIFGSNGKDQFWGRNLYTNRGENRLGTLLMELREKLQREARRDQR